MANPRPPRWFRVDLVYYTAYLDDATLARYGLEGVTECEVDEHTVRAFCATRYPETPPGPGVRCEWASYVLQR